MDISAEQVSGDNEGDNHYDGGDEQLPRPEVALEEERHDRECGSNDTTDNLRAEVQNNACHETPHATEQALIRTIA